MEMNVKHRVWTTIASQTLGAVTALAIGAGGAAAAGTGDARAIVPAVKDGKIAYVLTHRQWAVQMTEDGKQECPNGLNVGPREQFAELFPKDGPKVTVVESQLLRESLQALARPDDKDPFPFIEAVGPVAYGLNLDGKVKKTDFTSPEGVA